MNIDIIKISEWVYQVKMFFNPDLTIKGIFYLSKIKKFDHPTIYFNDAPVKHTNYQKHQGMFLK